jgi:hypothetical protein
LNAVDESTWTRYSQDIETKRQNWSCDSINKALKLNLSNDDCDDIWAELKLPTGLFDSLPLFDDGSDAEKQLIVGCTLTDWDWGSADTSCIVKTRWDPDYYKCYTIQVDPEYRQVRHISSGTDRNTLLSFFPSCYQPTYQSFALHRVYQKLKRSVSNRQKAALIYQRRSWGRKKIKRFLRDKVNGRLHYDKLFVITTNVS